MSFYHKNKLCLTVRNDLAQSVLFLAILVYCDNILKQKLSYEFTTWKSRLLITFANSVDPDQV